MELSDQNETNPGRNPNGLDRRDGAGAAGEREEGGGRAGRVSGRGQEGVAVPTGLQEVTNDI